MTKLRFLMSWAWDSKTSNPRFLRMGTAFPGIRNPNKLYFNASLKWLLLIKSLNKVQTRQHKQTVSYNVFETSVNFFNKSQQNKIQLSSCRRDIFIKHFVLICDRTKHFCSYTQTCSVFVSLVSLSGSLFIVSSVCCFHLYSTIIIFVYPLRL